ncbi:MAG: hypothetical protein ACLUFM_01120 [Lachnospiraceae bacterium]
MFNRLEKLTGLKVMEGFGQSETTLVIETLSERLTSSARWASPRRFTMSVS